MTATLEAERIAKLLVTRQEAAEALSLSLREVDEARRAGKLLAKKYGSKVLIPWSEVEQFAESLPWAPVKKR
ncbi:DNA binding domain, excisionase family [Mycobacteroides abscessus subsp. abscessus]|nr:DNA binding domain, excisionase family [Mycobacteroides abscessus subsp. abscessus]